MATIKPRAWMRRYDVDNREGTKGDRPKHWTFQPVSLEKLFEDDVALFSMEDDECHAHDCQHWGGQPCDCKG